ncbi:MAG TPA: hypothetical protein VLL27_03465 [Solirubrobacterales bacterium]|nr:hypothetical protein [Solirubrobacterales bacterium]
MDTSGPRKQILYALLLARGGRLADDEREWRELGRQAGYSGRSDLAGFYGGRIPSMIRAGGERRLTAAGWRRAQAAG